MFTFLFWFITVIIVLVVVCAIGWGLFMAYIYLSAANDPEVVAFGNAVDKLRKRELSDFIERENRFQDYLGETHKRERSRFENWKNKRSSFPGSCQVSGQNHCSNSVYVIDANGFKTKLKQVS